MNRLKNLLFTLIAAASTFAMAQNESIGWQKVQLEEKLNKAIATRLSLSFAPESFQVSTSITLSSVAQESFAADTTPPAEEKSPIRAPASAQNSAKTSMTIQIPNIGEIEGMGAEEFLDLLTLQSIQAQEYFDSPGTGRSPASTPLAMPSAKIADLFQSIASIDITLFIDESLSDDGVKLAEQIVNRQIASFKNLNPKLTTEKGKIIPEKTPPSLIEQLKEWAGPAGQIVSVILLGIFALIGVIIFFSKFNKIAQELLGVAQSVSDSMQKASDGFGTLSEAASGALSGGSGDGASAGGASAGSGTSGEAGLGGGSAGGAAGGSGSGASVGASAMERPQRELVGLSRFKDLYKSNEAAAIKILLESLDSRDGAAASALTFIAQSASPEELTELMSKIDQRAKEKWNRVLETAPTIDHSVAGELYLEKALARSILFVESKLGKTLEQDLEELGPEELQNLVNKNAEIAPALFNLCPPSVVSETVLNLRGENADEIIRLASNFDVSQIDSVLDAVRSAVSEEVSRMKIQGPIFTRSIPDLIAQASAEREKLLFQLLAEGQNWKSLKSTSQEYFPSELIGELSPESLKEILKAMDTKTQAAVCVTVEETLSQKLLASMGEPGSQARDVLDLEMSNITQNESRLEATKDDADIHWSKFLKTVRTQLKKNKKLEKESQQILATWIDRLVSEYEAGENKEAA